MMILSKPNNEKFIRIAETIRWVERREDGVIKEVHEDNPQVGFTLIISPYQPENTYQTKTITEIIINTRILVHFKIIDSEYKLKYFD
jgi:hypothetical protein